MCESFMYHSYPFTILRVNKNMKAMNKRMGFLIVYITFMKKMYEFMFK